MPKTQVVLLSVLPQVLMSTLPGDIDTVFYSDSKEWPSTYDKGAREVRYRGSSNQVGARVGKSGWESSPYNCATPCPSVSLPFCLSGPGHSVRRSVSPPLCLSGSAPAHLLHSFNIVSLCLAPRLSIASVCLAPRLSIASFCMLRSCPLCLSVWLRACPLRLSV
jgi:hypothetical protein